MPRFHPDQTLPTTNDWVVVFPSNLQGNVGPGASGSSQWYGLAVKISPQGPRMDEPTLRDIVDIFLAWAVTHPTTPFWVMHLDDRAAPMFANAPDNCNLPESWKPAPIPRDQLKVNPAVYQNPELLP